MKNSILTIFAVAALMACKKHEATAVDQSADSQQVATPSEPAMDSPRMVGDSATTPNASASATSLSDQDKKFADAAAKGGMMEVMMGKLAATNASSATVKSLGTMMVNDHSKANDELKKWATGVNYTLPTALDAEKQKKYDDLKAKKGAEFDRMYTDLMVSDHQKDVAEFKKEASSGTESSLKSFAGKTVPTLEHHLMESEKAKAAVK